MYEELEDKGDVKKEITTDNKTFVSLTEKGKKKCLIKLDELHDLRVYLSNIPSEDKYAEDKDEDKWVSKGVREGLTNTELKIEELITSISSWD